MVHTFKTINFGTRALIGYRDPNKVRLNKITKIATLSCLVALTVLAASAENPVTRSELYVELEQQTEEKAGIPSPWRSGPWCSSSPLPIPCRSMSAPCWGDYL